MPVEARHVGPMYMLTTLLTAATLTVADAPDIQTAAWLAHSVRTCKAVGLPLDEREASSYVERAVDAAASAPYADRRSAEGRMAYELDMEGRRIRVWTADAARLGASEAQVREVWSSRCREAHELLRFVRSSKSYP